MLRASLVVYTSPDRAAVRATLLAHHGVVRDRVVVGPPAEATADLPADAVVITPASCPTWAQQAAWLRCTNAWVVELRAGEILSPEFLAIAPRAFAEADFAGHAGLYVWGDRGYEIRAICRPRAVAGGTYGKLPPSIPLTLPAVTEIAA